jgi:hypothetical protein
MRCVWFILDIEILSGDISFWCSISTVRLTFHVTWYHTILLRENVCIMNELLYRRWCWIIVCVSHYSFCAPPALLWQHQWQTAHSVCQHQWQTAHSVYQHQWQPAHSVYQHQWQTAHSVCQHQWAASSQTGTVELFKGEIGEVTKSVIFRSYDLTWFSVWFSVWSSVWFSV